MKYLIILILAISSYKAYSQSIFVEYIQENQSGDPVFQNLICTDSSSIFKWAELDEKGFKNCQFLYKSKTTNFLYDYAVGLPKFFYVEDSLYTMSWSLKSDTLYILNKKCFKAETNFRGRSYIAYYTTDIPVSDGPWKFGGLPGLILEIKSTDGFVKWTAKQIIENYKNFIEPTTLQKIKYIPWLMYTVEYKKAALNYLNFLGSKDKVAAGTKRQAKIEIIEIFFPELQTGKGLEY
jgi:GLPGLI family protein